MLLRWARVGVALLGFAALVTEVATLVERGRFAPANFSSFFTVESNAYAAAVLLASALLPRSTRLDLFRGASTLFMATVFVVFSLLLSDLDPSILTAVPWDNTVLHFLVPIAVVADWLVEPPRQRIALRRTAPWLAVPVVYVVYSLVRGELVGWYPYPFLDPATGGWGRVVVVCLGITVVVLALAWLVTLVRARPRV